MTNRTQVVVIGGGQAGLAAGYHLRRLALSHLAPLQLRGRRGHIATVCTRAVDEPRLHLLGYGDWTGPASATLIGVDRPARDAARRISALLAAGNK